MKYSDLTFEPQNHFDCCLSLSRAFFQTLTDVIFQEHAPSSLVLSIGSGTGLLESLLHQHWLHNNVDATVEGVEVVASSGQPPVNIYLPEEAVNTVHGTWDLTNRAKDANVLMFVYPRDPKLVTRYLEDAARTSHILQTMVWLGPKVDWVELEPVFTRASTCFKSVEVVEQAGLVDYEMMVVIRREGREAAD